MAEDYNILNTTKKDKVQILIEGNLSLKNAEKIKNQFLLLDQNEKILEIDIKNVSDLDLSFLQILFSLIKNVKSEVSVTMSLTDEQKSLLDNAGLFELLDKDNSKLNLQ